MATLKKNAANQNMTFVFLNITNGLPLLGASITAFVTKDNGTQVIGAGVITEHGNGQYNYGPTQNETNATDAGFLFEAPGGIAVNYDFHTSNDELQCYASRLASYLTRSQAEAYFKGRLGTFAWDSASPTDQSRALIQATRQIEQLNFAGDLTSKTQPLQFPRGGDTQIPPSILNACAETALKLLDDIDIDLEASNLSVAENRFSSIITKKDTTQNPSDWVMAGIPSLTAWNLLRPFLIDPNTLTISRVS